MTIIYPTRCEGYKLDWRWRPIYDTQTIRGPGVYSFFQNPSGRPQSETNSHESGQIGFPNSFMAFGIRFQFPDLSDVEFLSLPDNVMARVQVGAINMWEAPLGSLLILKDQTCLTLATAFGPQHPYSLDSLFESNAEGEHLRPIIIPTLQNFWVSLEVPNSAPAFGSFLCRAQLDGPRSFTYE